MAVPMPELAPVTSAILFFMGRIVRAVPKLWQTADRDPEGVHT